MNSLKIIHKIIRTILQIRIEADKIKEEVDFSIAFLGSDNWHTFNLLRFMIMIKLETSQNAIKLTFI